MQCLFSAIFSKASEYSYLSKALIKAFSFHTFLLNPLFFKVLNIYKEKADTTPNIYYSLCSLTYVGAMLASNEALQHVSYPTQVLGKSIKPVPVMLLGVLIARKRYRFIKYIGVLLIVIGIVMFMKKDGSKHSKVKMDDPLPNHPFALVGFGEALLLISLAMDGLTGAIQDKMNTLHKTQTHTMMYFMNVWSCFWLFMGKWGKKKKRKIIYIF